MLLVVAAISKQSGGGGGGGDVTPPTVVSAEAIDANTVRVVFSESTTPSLSGYSFKINGSALSKDAVTSVNATTWGFSVGAMTSDDVITWSYDSSTGDTVDTSANELVSFTDAAVTNSVPAEHPFDLTTNNKVVRVGGTPGVDCDYVSIDDAYDDIVGEGVGNQFTLLLKNGTHVVKGPEFSTGSGIWMGIVSRPYIHFVGESKAGTIIINTVPPGGSETLVSTFAYPNTFLIKNCTIHAQNAKYPLHFDTNLYEYDQYVIDCEIEHLGGSTATYDFGCGFHGGQNLTVIRCETLASGIYAHGNEVNTRDLAKHFEIHIKETTTPGFQFVDWIEYSPNTIELIDNDITLVELNADSGNYDAHPGSPEDNQGFKVYTAITATGNTVGSVTRNSEAATILGTNFNDPSDFV